MYAVGDDRRVGAWRPDAVVQSTADMRVRPHELATMWQLQNTDAGARRDVLTDLWLMTLPLKMVVRGWRPNEGNL
jgi:hypothetical protein